ncbi:glucocorticoid modulatory element-binding protein 1-like [Lampris incognitus]|uniref:glucocorticoid modulatory element-binding protein 1-like n=1 Tax=Lampris incognitus TaxID=2546036 RepID=UPI0024B5B758|nr:glucocorticoid modulatory element-binding protein 1-like [Lampris incognitus]
MESAEVTVSSGNVTMVKEEGEEGEPSDNHKTQVILHLQPILHGLNDNIADTGSTVLAVETHHDESQVDGEEVEYGYPITCGDSRAVLLFKKFVCPGINVRCVKFNDQLISPKQFVHLAGKATLKDWKRAIRLGGVMLRKMMDSGQIDFYQHDTVCTNTCRSTKFDALINNARLPVGGSGQSIPTPPPSDPLGGQLAPLPGEVMLDAAEVEEPSKDKFSATADEWSPRPAPTAAPNAANGHVKKRMRTDIPDGILSLWKGVADIGLMGEVLSNIQTELLATLKGVEVRCEKANLQETDAMFLNTLCEMFGLLDSVKQALDLRRCQTEEDRVHSSLYALDDALEEEEKQGYDEGNAYKTVFSKELRVRRQSPSTSQTQHEPQAGQGTVSPIATDPVVIRPVTGVSLASFAHLSANPQHFTYFSPFISAGRRLGSGVLHRAAGREKHGRRGTAEVREIGNREKEHSQEQDRGGGEDTCSIHKDLEVRTVGVREEDSHFRGEAAERTEKLNDIDRAVVKRMPFKKFKAK